jgi:hypothetical protein
MRILPIAAAFSRQLIDGRQQRSWRGNIRFEG